MINVKQYLNGISQIEVKQPLPQVGSRCFLYQSLDDIDEELNDFIVDSEGFLKIGRGHYKLNKKKTTLYFAGRLKVKDGLITYIDNDSGHYGPTKQDTLNFIQKFSNSDLFSKDFIFKIYDSETIDKQSIQ